MEWPNSQARGDEEGIKMPHYSHSYPQRTQPYDDSWDNHSLFAVSSSILQYWKWYLLPLPERMSVLCNEKCISTGTPYSPLKVLHRGIWLPFHDFWQCILIALLSFQDAVLSRVSALQVIKWSIHEKHSVNKWCTTNASALFFIGLLI